MSDAIPLRHHATEGFASCIANFSLKSFSPMPVERANKLEKALHIRVLKRPHSPRNMSDDRSTSLTLHMSHNDLGDDLLYESCQTYYQILCVVGLDLNALLGACPLKDTVDLSDELLGIPGEGHADYLSRCDRARFSRSATFSSRAVARSTAPR